jgi:hypothetical protein
MRVAKNKPNCAEFVIECNCVYNGTSVRKSENMDGKKRNELLQNEKKMQCRTDEKKTIKQKMSDDRMAGWIKANY